MPTITKHYFDFFFSYNNEESKKYFSMKYELEDNRFLKSIIKQNFINDITWEDLGEYFHDPEDFNKDGEFEKDDQFLIYYEHMDLLIQAFWHEFQEKCNEFGKTDKNFINFVVQDAVIEYELNLN